MIEVTIYKQAKEENLATLGVDRMEINNMDCGVISFVSKYKKPKAKNVLV